MWDQLITSAMANGIWAVMFCSLLIYQLKDSKRREQKYNDIIDGLTSSLKNTEQILDRINAVDSDIKVLVARKLKNQR